MSKPTKSSSIPYGIVTTPADIGAIVRGTRARAGVTQVDAAGLSGVGVRFLSELENGKPTVELHKVLQVLARMGLEVRVTPRGDDR